MALVHQRGWSAHARSESPWYFPLRALWDKFERCETFPTPTQLSALYAARLAELRGLTPEVERLSFVAAPAKKTKRRKGHVIALSELYEGQIVECGQVPTRLDDWHDFFNALTFAAFPRAKWTLHRRQYQLLKRRLVPGAQKLPGARTREQDALALFDEGGIALLVEPGSQSALAAGDFADAVKGLCRAGKARAVPFGHALAEHLVEGLGCPLGTMHTVALDFAALALPELLDRLDLRLAHDLSEPTLFAAPSPERGLSLEEIGAAMQERPIDPR